MKKSAKHIVFAIIATLLLTSCFTENMDSFGSYYVYMSKDTSYLELKDTLLRQSNDTLAKDSSVKVLGVTRSGIATEYPALTIQLRVDSAYMDSMKMIYMDASIPAASKPSTVLYFKNTLILPADCYNLDRTLIIPKDKMTGQIGLRLNLTKIAKLNSQSWLILPLTIVSTSVDTIQQTKRRVMVRFNPKFIYKNVTE